MSPPFEDGTTLTRDDLLKQAAALAAGATVLGSASRASGALIAKPRGGILRAAFTDAAQKDVLDPAFSDDTLSVVLHTSLYERLVGVDPFWTPTPQLATHWEASPDLTVWTFHLRPAEFHNGRPLTAADVAYSIRRLLNPKLGSGIFGPLSADLDPSGIRVLDRRTIRFKLKRPDTFFPINLSTRWTGIVPAGTTHFAGIGTGPFRLKSFAPGRSFELRRHPGYWQHGIPYLDGVRGVVIPDQSTKVQAVLSGSADVGDPIDYSAIATVQRSGSARLLRQKNAINYRIVFDSTKSPFDDSRVRLALKLAENRQQLLAVALQGYGKVTSDTPILPGSPDYPSGLGIRKQNAARARDLLAAAGYPDGIDVTLNTSEAYSGMVDLAVVYAQQVAAAGIRMKVRLNPPETYWSNVWKVAPAFISYAITRHPYPALALHFSSNNPTGNESNMNNAAFEKLLKQIPQTKNPRQQRKLIQQAAALVANDSGTLIPAFGDNLWIARKNVQGMRFDLIRFADYSHATLA